MTKIIPCQARKADSELALRTLGSRSRLWEERSYKKRKKSIYLAERRV